MKNNFMFSMISNLLVNILQEMFINLRHSFVTFLSAIPMSKKLSLIKQFIEIGDHYQFVVNTLRLRTNKYHIKRILSIDVIFCFKCELNGPALSAIQICKIRTLKLMALQW